MQRIFKMKKALIVGGNSGMGLSMSLNLLSEGYGHVYIVGKELPDISDVPPQFKDTFLNNTTSHKIDLLTGDLSLFDSLTDIDTLIITCGFGRVAPFEELKEREVDNLIGCNLLAVVRLIERYYSRICSTEDFYTLVLGSIAGHVCSPLFSVYGAAKMGLCGFIENVNAELAAKGLSNRILDVSPGSVKNTRFAGGNNDVSALMPLTEQMILRMREKQTLFIPDYEEIYKDVIRRYREDPMKFGVESYNYKMKANRVDPKPQLVIGYLSGTFDLFHIGHLNLLKRARAQCDYLIVGVHESGSWKGKETFIPYEERVEILRACKYVDRVVMSLPEDTDAYEEFKIHKLFVGSDYKGTERFRRYEEFFADKGVEIVYFPYTNGTSSTQLREKLSKR